MPLSEKVYNNSAGTVSGADCETSFDDTLIRIRCTENDNRPVFTPKYKVYIHIRTMILSRVCTNF